MCVIRKIRRRNAEQQRTSDAKEQIIRLLSKDLRNPANAHRLPIYAKMGIRNVADMLRKAGEPGFL